MGYPWNQTICEGERIDFEDLEEIKEAIDTLWDGVCFQEHQNVKLTVHGARFSDIKTSENDAFLNNFLGAKFGSVYGGKYSTECSAHDGSYNVNEEASKFATVRSAYLKYAKESEDLDFHADDFGTYYDGDNTIDKGSVKYSDKSEDYSSRAGERYVTVFEGRYTSAWDRIRGIKFCRDDYNNYSSYKNPRHDSVLDKAKNTDNPSYRGHFKGEYFGENRDYRYETFFGTQKSNRRDTYYGDKCENES